MDPSLVEAWLRAFDAVVDARVRRAQARRTMKSSIMALAAALALLAVDARIASALLQAAAPTDVAKWLTFGFTMVSAIVTIAISFTVVRVTVNANQKATDAALAERAHVKEFVALQRQVDRQHEELRDDIAELRKEVRQAIGGRAS